MCLYRAPLFSHLHTPPKPTKNNETTRTGLSASSDRPYKNVVAHTRGGAPVACMASTVMPTVMAQLCGFMRAKAAWNREGATSRIRP